MSSTSSDLEKLYLKDALQLAKQYPGVDALGTISTLSQASLVDIEAIQQFKLKKDQIYTKSMYSDAVCDEIPKFTSKDGSIIDFTVDKDDILAIPVLQSSLFPKTLHIVSKSRYEQLRNTLNLNYIFLSAKLEQVASSTSKHFKYVDRNEIDLLLEYRRKLLDQAPESIVHYDIASFYSNIYSHIIAWLSVGIDEAKRNLRQDLWFNTIDEAVRNCIRKETNGIPIGPKLFDVVAEYILKCIDEKLVQTITSEFQSQDFMCIRRSDNYEFYLFTTLISEEELSVLISSVLSDYRLNINALKVRFESDPLQDMNGFPPLSKVAEIVALYKNSMDYDLVLQKAAECFCKAELQDRVDNIHSFTHPSISWLVIKEYLKQDLKDMDKNLTEKCLSRIAAPWRVKWNLQMMWIVKMCIERNVGFANNEVKIKNTQDCIIVNTKLHRSMSILKAKSNAPFDKVISLMNIIK